MHAKPAISFLILSALFGASFLMLSGCAFTGSKAHKNLTYATASGNIPKQQLNIFEPKKPKSPKEVLIFIHGGNWNSGKKSQYNLMARNWTRKNIVTVIPDYPLSPNATFKEMAVYTARSVKWVKENIRDYGGNPDRIFIAGHSAGGHLAALVAMDEQYFSKLAMENPIKGVILIDAAGLDMYGYLQEEKFQAGHTYLKIFTAEPKIWKEASPLYHLHKNIPPMTILLGGKTYPSIAASHDKFIKALQTYAPATPIAIQKNKKHIPMITQFFNPWNKRFGQIQSFMKKVQSEESAKN